MGCKEELGISVIHLGVLEHPDYLGRKLRMQVSGQFVEEKDSALIERRQDATQGEQPRDCSIRLLVQRKPYLTSRAQVMKLDAQLHTVADAAFHYLCATDTQVRMRDQLPRPLPVRTGQESRQMLLLHASEAATTHVVAGKQSPREPVRHRIQLGML